MSGEGRRIGMKVTLDRMKSSLENAGVRIFFKHKVLSLTKGDKSKGESTVDMVFENGKKMRGITRAILNIGKPDLIALGHLSEPMFSASESFKRHVDRLFVYGLSKTYCFWVRTFLWRCLPRVHSERRLERTREAKGTILTR